MVILFFINWLILIISLISLVVAAYGAAALIRYYGFKVLAVVFLAVFVSTALGLLTGSITTQLVTLGVLLAVGTFLLLMLHVTIPTNKVHVYQPVFRSTKDRLSFDECLVVYEGIQFLWDGITEKLRLELPSTGRIMIEGKGDPKSEDGAIEVQVEGGKIDEVPFQLTVEIDWDKLERFINDAREPNDEIDKFEPRVKYIKKRVRLYIAKRLEQVARNIQGLSPDLTPDTLLATFKRDTDPPLVQGVKPPPETDDVGTKGLEALVSGMGLKIVDELKFGDFKLSDELQQQLHEHSEGQTVIEVTKKFMAAEGLKDPAVVFNELFEEQKGHYEQLAANPPKAKTDADIKADVLAEQKSAAEQKLASLLAQKNGKFQLTPEAYRLDLSRSQSLDRRGNQPQSGTPQATAADPNPPLTVKNLDLWQRYSQEYAALDFQIKQAQAEVNATELSAEFRTKYDALREKSRVTFAEFELMKKSAAAKSKKGRRLYGPFLDRYTAYRTTYSRAFNEVKEFVAGDKDNTRRFVAGGDFRGMFANASGNPEVLVEMVRSLSSAAKQKGKEAK